MLWNLKLANHDAWLELANGCLCNRWVGAVVCARDDDEAILPLSVNPDWRNAAALFNGAHPGSVNLLLDEVLHVRGAVRVISNCVDHGDRSTESRRHHRLIRTLAAEAHLESVANERLANFREALRVGDEIHHGAPDHKNACFAHLLMSLLCGARAASAAGLR